MGGKQDEKIPLPRRWIGDEIEEEYFKENRKSSKIERKIASAKDRSKYKKTDREKFKKSEELHKNIKLSKEKLLTGRVLSIVPEGIMVEYEGQTIPCTLRGLLKKDKSQFKNLVTVGDFVLFEKGANEGLIAHVQPRKSVLSRADNLSRRKEQLIAANIDQVLITVSVVEPPLKASLVDRYIIAARKGKMDPVVVVNKIDLLNVEEAENQLVAETERLLFEELLAAYASVEIPVVRVSTATGEGLDGLRAVMKDKASVFSGQSGVGKTSLINAITHYNLDIGDVVGKTKKGAHTTTTAKLLPLEFGGWCIDTPGIKSFGIWDLKKEEIEEYFAEIHAHGRGCHYPDCSHLHEAGCAVQLALEKEQISAMRYESYVALIDSVSQKHLRR